MLIVLVLLVTCSSTGPDMEWGSSNAFIMCACVGIVECILLYRQALGLLISSFSIVVMITNVIQL